MKFAVRCGLLAIFVTEKSDRQDEISELIGRKSLAKK